MKRNTTYTIFLALLIVFVYGTAEAQTPEQLFQKGIMKEEGEGSLKEAIELYKSVADDTNANRAIRAKALYQMGNCYEKLGQQEARKVYEKLVANYTEQTELVASAKLKLNKLYLIEPKTEISGIKINQLQFESYPSPEGNYIATYDWGNYPAVEIVEAKTGKKSMISDKGDWTNFPLFYPNGGVTFSPDSKKVAYGWAIEKQVDKQYTYYSEIHVANIDGSNNHVITGDSLFYDIEDWSTDGKYILVIKRTNLVFRPSENEKNALYIISINDGKESLVSNLGNRKIEGASFTNDGKYVVFNAQTEFKSENYDIYSVPINGGDINPLVTNREKDCRPFRVPGTNSLVFLSTHSGNNDLWEIKLKDGVLKNEPMVIKYNLDISSILHGFKNDGTIYFSTKKLYPSDFYTGKMDIENKKIQLVPLDVKRTIGMPIRRVLWSPTMNKVACFLQSGKNIPSGEAVKTPIDWIIKDQITGKEVELKNDLKFHLENMFVGSGWWTSDEKSIIIRAWDPNDTEGLYQIDVETGEYTLISPFNKMPGKLKNLFYSADKETAYYWYNNNSDNGGKIIAKTIKTGEERLIKQFDISPTVMVLSPDGQKIAAYQSEDLSVNCFYLKGDNNITKLTEPKLNVGWPIGWSADSQKIFLEKINEEKNGIELWTLAINDKSLELLYSTDQLEKLNHARNLTVFNVNNSNYLTMKSVNYVDEMWEMENLFTANK